ncbi:c-type cytochrome [Cognatilysobacter lacus]|uniref:C-type cytochrome n=1 Tax=Cognatilysobacter lacus TaxID=1643323 RepID=A0A5D8Z7Z7_9GAMM|nr:c-type cytochrome [Lysobacter lacus]TZF90797.1 c-type cytochrome [Lysobacter lacus]
MKTGAAVLGMLASAAIGAAAAGWITSTRNAPLAGGAVGPVPMPMASPPAPVGIPLGDVAGGRADGSLLGMENPLGEGPAVVADGKRLFRQMNCAYCHGMEAKGAMGPDLTDLGWRYGGAPAQIYDSIAAGRPKGMPAWGRALSPELIWEMTAYVHSLGGGIPPQQAVAAMHGDYRGETSENGTSKAPSRGGEASADQ